MTPLEQAAQEYAEKIRPITGLDKHDAPFITAFEHNGDIEEAFKEGANWQASQGWVSVKERLPDPLTFVLATLKSNSDEWVEIAGYDGNSWDLPGRDKTSFVTHWQPLPQPLKI